MPNSSRIDPMYIRISRRSRTTSHIQVGFRCSNAIKLSPPILLMLLWTHMIYECWWRISYYNEIYSTLSIILLLQRVTIIHVS